MRSRSRPSFAVVAACLAGLLGLAAATAQAADYDPRKVSVDDLEIVDCILPGQVRSLGRMTYQTPRRQARLARIECGVRGGEAKLYDRTDTKSALESWLPVAEGGDVEAMNRVALIFEGAFGGTPNPERAAQWYRRAAEAGHKPAMYSLGVILEQGKGVPKDIVEALNWYRRASGLENDQLRLSSDAQREIGALRASLEAEIAEARAQTDALERRVAELQAKVAAEGAAAGAAKAEKDALEKLVAGLRAAQAEKQTTLASLSPFRTPVDVAPPKLDGSELPLGSIATGRPRQSIALDGRDFGRYFALVIGNQAYQHLDPLASPRADATRVAELLESKYGFEVTLITDGSAAAIKRAVNELDTRAGENDNVLIYFAGHGTLRDVPGADASANRQGFWLPVEAEEGADTFWIDNMWVTEHLAINKARRVLVVADSCYAGLFSADPSVLLTEDVDYTPDELTLLAAQRARYVLSSGDVKPVLDGGADGHSVFARAFIETLEQNSGLMSAIGLYGAVFERVATAARALGLEQLPQLRPIRPAGHEWGDFFFVAADGAAR
jgi:hypothetical protein